MKTHETKREEGAERNASWRVLTPYQQLTTLDRRLGKDHGAKRQRAMICSRLAPESVPEPVLEPAKPALTPSETGATEWYDNARKNPRKRKGQ